VTGSFTLNLPVAELKDVRLLYAGRAYKYEAPSSPGATVTVFLDDSSETTTGSAASPAQGASR